MKIAVVVQARTGSTRLPNKVCLPILGEPLLRRMIDRVRAASDSGGTPFECVVATTVDAADDAVVDIAARAGVTVVRGHPTDLLARHLTAARAVGADVVAKIPSDCPLIDPAVIDRVLAYYVDNTSKFDFVSNMHPASYPDGNDVEVFSTALLEIADREATRPLEREHTTPFFWERPERFRIGNVAWGTGKNLSMSHRFTIDYEEDYAFVRAVYEALYPANPRFTVEDIVALCEREPRIYALNAKYAGVNWYRHHLEELRTVGSADTRSP